MVELWWGQRRPTTLGERPLQSAAAGTSAQTATETRGEVHSMYERYDVCADR